MSISSSPRTPRPCLKSWLENPFSKPRHIIRTLFPAKFGAAGKGVGGEISSLRQMLGSNGHILPLKGSWAHLAMGEAAWVFQGISAQPWNLEHPFLPSANLTCQWKIRRNPSFAPFTADFPSQKMDCSDCSFWLPKSSMWAINAPGK